MARFEAVAAPPGMAGRIERLSARIDRIIESDRRFFRRKPWRRHRVRLASGPEIEVQSLLTGCPRVLPPKNAYYIAVRQIQPGMRVRVLFASTAGNDTDIPEAEARWIYERFGRGALTVEDEEHGRRACGRRRAAATTPRAPARPRRSAATSSRRAPGRGWSRTILTPA